MKYFLDENDELYKKNLNKWSFPFNGGENYGVNAWLKKIDKYKPFIHDIYMSAPPGNDFFKTKIDRNGDYLKRCRQLLQILKDTKEYRSVVTLNGNYTALTTKQKMELSKRYIEEMNRYDVYGCVCSNFDMAVFIHQMLPNLVINTSCNVPQYSVEMLEPWRKYAGVDIINPCRNSSRDVNLLKSFHDNGYKVKLLVNEPCSLSCPNIVSMCANSWDKTYKCFGIRSRNPFLHTCIVIPRWLNIFDDFVEIYKLTGRYVELHYTLNQFNHYLTRNDDCTYNEFMFVCGLPIKCSDIPDEVIICDKQCDKCKDNLCTKIENEYVEKYKDELMKNPHKFLFRK